MAVFMWGALWRAAQCSSTVASNPAIWFCKWTTSTLKTWRMMRQWRFFAKLYKNLDRSSWSWPNVGILIRKVKVAQHLIGIMLKVFLVLGYFTIPRSEPVRPIDPGAWLAHTQALRSCENLETDSEVLTAIKTPRLNVNLPYKVIVGAMKKPDSGLEIRDRLWLKITIPNAFIGRWEQIHFNLRILYSL